MLNRSGFGIELFLDSAKIDQMIEASSSGMIKGFTTNPTLMKQAGVSNYADFARKVVQNIPDLPVSFEVFSDDFNEMEKEAREINSWGNNIYVKIPVANTKGESSLSLIKKLLNEGISVNITAVLTLRQVETISNILSYSTTSIVSVFAGRIADTGVDPEPIMSMAANILKPNPKVRLLWASSREVFNIFQAKRCGCHIITITSDLLKKLCLIGMDLKAFSVDTVKMFYGDAQAAGYKVIEKKAEINAVLLPPLKSDVLKCSTEHKRLE